MPDPSRFFLRIKNGPNEDLFVFPGGCLPQPVRTLTDG